MAGLLRRLGGFCARHGLIVVAIWVLILVGVVGAVSTFGSQTNNDLSLPGTGSQEVKDLLTDRYPPQQNGANPIVFDISKGKLTDQANKKAVNASIKEIRKQPHVYSVTNPVSSSGQTAGLLSKDKQTAFAPVLMDVDSGDLTEEIAGNVLDATKPAQDAGITTAAAGSIGSTLSTDESEMSEIVGIIAAMIILTLVLGSLVAMGLPIITAVVGLAVGLATVGLIGHALAIPSSGPTLATMIGLGVGIDYALFLITRHQDQLRDGFGLHDSVANAVATSGSAIVFAGTTVVIALLALGVAGIPMVTSLGIASALAVVTAVLVAITLLPAFLGLVGHRIAWLSLPAFMRPKKPHDQGVWAKWAGVVRRHPWPIAAVSLAALVPLIIPVFSLELGQEDVGATSPETTERQAYDLISAGFGVGYNGPLQVASLLEPPAAPSKEYTQKYNKAMSLKKDLEKKQKQLPKQQKQLEAQQAQLEDQQAELEAEQASLENQQAQLEQEDASLQQQADQLRVQQADLERQADQLRARQATLEREQAQLERRAAQVRREAEALAAKIRPLAREEGRLLLRERFLEREIERAEQQGNDARADRLRARLADVQARAAEVRQQLKPLVAQARRIAAQVRRLEAQANQLNNQAAALQRQADELNRQKAQLQQEGAALQARGDELQNQADQLRAEGASLQRQGNALQNQANQLQQQAHELKAEQKQAKQEQKEAEQLQKELTQMMTAAGGDDRGTDPRVVNLQKGLSDTDGVVSLTPPQINKKGDVVLLSAIPSTAPASDDTADLVNDVRDDVLPATNEGEDITSYVGGFTASYVDLATLITARLLLVIGIVILLGYLLLMVAFRSLLIPLQAAITNLLSAAASFGVLTAAFQWGWGISLVGIDTPDSSVPIASYVPLMMFAVLFGLSMDYEVFLVSHLQQHHAEGQEAREAVRSALISSSRITTAAALIMSSVFASFILNIDPTIKQFGVGLSVAVLLAGILVVTLAPATLVIFGRAAWWLPGWLDKILPHVSIEGGDVARPDAAPAAAEEPEPVPAGAPTSAAEPDGSAGQHRRD